MVLVPAFMLPLGWLLVGLSGPPAHPIVSPISVAQVGFAATMVFVFGFLLAITHITKVRLESTGVTFHFAFHRERRAWIDLEPITQPPSRKAWGVSARRRDGRPSRYRLYILSIEQAQALVEYPACPRWPLNREVRAGLGLRQ